jgi:hypothetical protein
MTTPCVWELVYFGKARSPKLCQAPGPALTLLLVFPSQVPG